MDEEPAFVTHVEAEGHFLRFWAQNDRHGSTICEQSLMNVTGRLSASPPPPPLKLREGLLVAVHLHDRFYRARLTAPPRPPQPLRVRLVDFGPEECVGPDQIRLLDDAPEPLRTVPGFAFDFLLARVCRPDAAWPQKVVEIVKEIVSYKPVLCRIERAVGETLFVRVCHGDEDLADVLVKERYAIDVGVDRQAELLRSRSLAKPPRKAATPRPPNRAQEFACANYKSRQLERGAEHRVRVVHAEEGPRMFAVRLESDERALALLAAEIGAAATRPLAGSEPPAVGAVCLGRCSEDGSARRAVVAGITASRCTLFFVDYGVTESVPFSDVYRVPEELVVPSVFAIRFCLAGSNEFAVTEKLKRTFAAIVRDRPLSLRVVAPEGPAFVQYCELYDDGVAVLESLKSELCSNLSFKTISPFDVVGEHRVLVSFVDSCTKFYVQLLKYSDALDDTMRALDEHCSRLAPLSFVDVKPGTVCCALFPDDQKWYRARVCNIKKDKITVLYVDYGNEQDVTVDCLKPIASHLLKLKAQAIHCALRGYEDKPFVANVTDEFESATIEAELTMRVHGTIEGDVLLVELVNDSVAPAIDISEYLSSVKTVREKPVDHQHVEEDYHVCQEVSPPQIQHRENFDNSRGSRGFNNERYHHKDYSTKPQTEKNYDNYQSRKKNQDFRTKSSSSSDSYIPKNKTNYMQKKNQTNSTNQKLPYSNPKQNYRGNENRSDRNDKYMDETGPRKKFISDKPRNFNRKHEYVPNKTDTRPTRTRETNYNTTNYIRDNQTKSKCLSNPATLNTSFKTFITELPLKCEVNVSWIINPSEFYVQNSSQMSQFRVMMQDIQKNYTSIEPLSYKIPTGSAVLAQFPEDSVLYRAIVVGCNDYEYFVYFVDFGNRCTVNKDKLWQLEYEHFELPMMAVKCSLRGIIPANENWSTNFIEDSYFKDIEYNCTFHSKESDTYTVSLINTANQDVGELLVDNSLAICIDKDNSNSIESEGEEIDFTVIIGQCFYTQICQIESLSKFYLLLNVSKDSLSKKQLSSNGTTFMSNHLIEGSIHNSNQGNKELITKEAFKSKFEDQFAISYINSVSQNRLFVTLYDCKLGTRIEFFSVINAIEKVPVLCSLPIYNTHFGIAFASHIESVNEIYLQRYENINNLPCLLDALYNFYEGANQENLTSLHIDDLCVVKSSDGNWYRAKFKQKINDEYEIQYVDYGNKEIVSYDSIRHLDPQFFVPSEQALLCSLELTTLQIDLEKFKELISDKELCIDVSTSDIGWISHIKINNVDVIQILQPNIPSTVALKESPIIDEIEEHLVLITHIDSPGQFWLKFSTDNKNLQMLHERIQGEVSKLTCLTNYDVGTHCIAKYSADDQYYRAVILDSDSDITTVRFIDFGNTDVLDNQPEILKCLPKELADIKPYAVKCSVNASPAGVLEWTEQASELFTKLVEEKNEPIKAHIILRGIITYVNLYVDELNITEKLVEGGFATPADSQNNGKLPTCYASHINSPSEFWIQLESSVTDLEVLSEQLSDAENFPPINEIEEGVLCAAKFPEDGCWYRAKVIIHGSDGTEVLFMDYGNASLTNELRSLPEDLKNLPALSRKCTLQKPLNAEMWSEKAEIKFSEIAADGATVFQILFVASGDISVVELYYENKPVTDELNKLQESTAVITSVIDDIDNALNTEFIDQIVEPIVYISHCLSPEDFWIQYKESNKYFDIIKKSLKKSDQLEPLVDPKEEDLCVSLFKEDNLWYRSKVMDVSDNGTTIIQIDYGSIIVSQELKKMPVELSKIPPLAKNCCLSLDSDKQFSEKNEEKFFELSGNKTQEYHIDIVDSSVQPLVVKLYIKDLGESINVLKLIGMVDDDSDSDYGFDEEMANQLENMNKLDNSDSARGSYDNIPHTESHNSSNEQENTSVTVNMKESTVVTVNLMNILSETKDGVTSEKLVLEHTESEINTENQLISENDDLGKSDKDSDFELCMDTNIDVRVEFDENITNNDTSIEKTTTTSESTLQNSTNGINEIINKNEECLDNNITEQLVEQFQYDITNEKDKSDNTTRENERECDNTSNDSKQIDSENETEKKENEINDTPTEQLQDQITTDENRVDTAHQENEEKCDSTNKDFRTDTEKNESKIDEKLGEQNQTIVSENEKESDNIANNNEHDSKIEGEINDAPIEQSQSQITANENIVGSAHHKNEEKCDSTNNDFKNDSNIDISVEKSQCDITNEIDKNDDTSQENKRECDSTSNDSKQIDSKNETEKKGSEINDTPAVQLQNQITADENRVDTAHQENEEKCDNKSNNSTNNDFENEIEKNKPEMKSQSGTAAGENKESERNCDNKSSDGVNIEEKKKDDSKTNAME